MSEGVDTAIVGAGIFGLATAHALCRDGAGRDAVRPGGPARATPDGRSRWCAATTPTPSRRGSRSRARGRSCDWADEVGVADAGYVRCGYLLTVPERLGEACRGNVELAAGPRPRHALPRRRRDRARSSRSSRSEGVAGAAYEPDGGFADAQKMCLGWYAAASAHGLDAPARLRRDGDPRRGWPRARRRDAMRLPRRPTGSCWRPARGGTTCCGRWAPSSRSRCAGCRSPSCASRSARAADRRLLRRRHERRRPPRPRAAVLRGRLLRRRAARARRRLRPRHLRGLRGRRSAGRLRALSRGSAASSSARLRGPVRLVARLESDHRPLPRHRGPLPGARLVRPRLQALAGGRRGGRGRGDRTHAADRRLRPAPGPVRRGQLLHLAYGPGARA